MAIIACKECGHQISDQAATCPGCGAPVAARPAPRPLRRALYSFLITCVALWLIGATFWILRTLRAPNTPIADRSARVASRVPPVERSLAVDQAANHPASTSAAPSQAQGSPRLVYQTTAEALYQDYGANGVATQSRIGSSRVRVTGSVAEIDEDAFGHPVVKLAAGGDGSTEMTLTSDQTAAAAQLVKGETVDIECDKMQRVLASPHGSDCALVLVDARSLPSHLATDYAANSGPGGSAAASGENVNALTTSAHARSAHARRKRHALPAQPSASHAQASEDDAPPVAGPIEVPSQNERVPEVTEITASDGQTVPLPSPQNGIAAARDQSAAAAAPGTAAVPGTAAAPGAAAVLNTAMTRPGGGIAPAQSSPPAAIANAPASDDLSIVRAADPRAAEHIASYCMNTSAGAANPAASAAGCRHDEVNAWTRLVRGNEFPALDDATRRKCSEPPFPDSYVAKELCAKYELHLD